jgi:LacI family transcriptional regulator
MGSLISPSVNRERYQGFCEAVEAHGLSPASMPMITCRHTYGAAAQAIKSIRAETPETTGVVCFNDIIAFGATLGLYELGLSPGHDISVIGFDDVEAARNWRPPLTTMSIEARQLGKQAATLLAQRMEQPELPPRQQYSKAILQVRESCYPPKS